MTLYDLIFKAGGYVDEEFKKNTYLDRAELVRINGDNNEKRLYLLIWNWYFKIKIWEERF